MSKEKEINSDLIYFFNICNLIQTPDDEKSNQLRIELDNQVSMYELTKEIECKDTGRKYRLHIKHYGEFGDTHMVDIHWKYQNPDEHNWNILNVLTVRFNKNKQLYRIINDTYKEKIDNPLRFGLIDWRDNMTTNFEMQRVRMFLDHFIDQIMHCSVNGNATMQCKKETGYTRCVWMIPSLCNPDRKEEIKLKKNELMEEKDMKNELVDLRIESDINKLIDIITRNKQGVMELDQTREDQDHPEKKYKIRINRDYEKNHLIITYAEFSDKTFDASKPNEITQIIIAFYRGAFTDGGAKDSIKKIKIKTTIQDYKALKWFLADEYDIMHINEIMKFAYARLSPMKIEIEQRSYHKMLKKYQGKD